MLRNVVINSTQSLHIQTRRNSNPFEESWLKLVSIYWRSSFIHFSGELHMQTRRSISNPLKKLP